MFKFVYNLSYSTVIQIMRLYKIALILKLYLLSIAVMLIGVIGCESQSKQPSKTNQKAMTESCTCT